MNTTMAPSICRYGTATRSRYEQTKWTSDTRNALKIGRVSSGSGMATILKATNGTQIRLSSAAATAMISAPEPVQPAESEFSLLVMVEQARAWQELLPVLLRDLHRAASPARPLGLAIPSHSGGLWAGETWSAARFAHAPTNKTYHCRGASDSV